jgi:hypothetical protein
MLKGNEGAAGLAPHLLPAISVAKNSPMRSGGLATVGDSSSSYFSKKARACCHQARRSSHACTYRVGGQPRTSSTIASRPGSISLRRSRYGIRRVAMPPKNVSRQHV